MRARKQMVVLPLGQIGSTHCAPVGKIQAALMKRQGKNGPAKAILIRWPTCRNQLVRLRERMQCVVENWRLRGIRVSDQCPHLVKIGKRSGVSRLLVTVREECSPQILSNDRSCAPLRIESFRYKRLQGRQHRYNHIRLQPFCVENSLIFEERDCSLNTLDQFVPVSQQCFPEALCQIGCVGRRFAL